MTARTRKIRHSAKPRAGKYIALMGVIITLALIAAFVVAGINLMRSWLDDLPDYSDSDAYLLAEPTKVLDAAGNTIAEFYFENRIPITIEECSQWVLWGTVDTEDERFYSHSGVDLKGIMRAVVAQIAGGSEGASTITQQLVRNTVLKDEQFEKTLSRKVREAYIALELEKIYSKDEILMMYLNSVYYGQGCYGVEAAAQTYFGKTCKDLTLAEAALIAGLPQSPSAYDPTIYPDRAIERRNVVLGHLLDCDHITQSQYDEAIETPLQLNYTPRATSGATIYPYFVEYVKGKLQEQFSTDIIFKGGLTVKTTIDPFTQQCAEDATHSITDWAWDDLEAALVAIDPDTGYIKAMVGGKDYTVDQFNLATQAKRQPGSSFKTFTLVAALEAGMSPLVLIDANSPITIGDWTVANINWESYGTISLRQAMLWSSNVVFAQVINEIGVDAVIDVARRMGITSDLAPYNSLTLGVSECTVLEMATAYATLASGGVYHEPTVITEVLDRNSNVLYQHEVIGVQVISPEVAYAATQILQDVIYDPTGTGTEAAPWVDQPAAGKTGTTDSYKDLWFCGYTPQFAAAVWVGYRTPAVIYYQGSEGTTHNLPNPIFSRFMTAVLQGLPREEFPWANSPAYLNDWTWSISRGTWTEPVPEPEPEPEHTTDGTTTTTPDNVEGDVTVTEPEA